MIIWISPKYQSFQCPCQRFCRIRKALIREEAMPFTFMASFQHACLCAVITTAARIVAPARRGNTNAAIHHDNRSRLDVTPGIETKWDIWFMFFEKKTKEKPNVLHRIAQPWQQRQHTTSGRGRKRVKTGSVDSREGRNKVLQRKKCRGYPDHEQTETGNLYFRVRLVSQ